MYIRAFILLFWCCFIIIDSKGQDQATYINDSTLLNTGNVQQIKARNFFDPSKAALWSAVLPGLGQAYNKKYWKIPIVWGGMVLGIYLADVYNNEMQFWREELFLYLNGQPPTTPVSQGRVEQLIQRYRRDRDQTIIYTFMWYGLNIVDAHVDAYLKEFEVNDDLTLKVKPYIDYTAGSQINTFTGVSLVMRIR